MPHDPAKVISYKRSRFQTRLPKNRIYTASHFWLEEINPSHWRVGYTRFATRMLGEVVELGFEVKPDETISVGQVIGWIEGFKARSDIYCVGQGVFVGSNPRLDAEPVLIDKDPYYDGWLYEFRGAPDANTSAVDAYTKTLDAAIDKIMS